ncbi:hypothetical protein TNCT_422371 [Trichonephila clavata]|uniref:Zinc finger protein n=1 Tax=Trichonephila clavata TaxID=2740835 RepID=A0A8X6LYZ7_TRICU|nr:hypothetical protein TNCT_422371 [Trichonephila clavata]
MAESKDNPTEEEFYYSCYRCRNECKSRRLTFFSISSQETEFNLLNEVSRFDSTVVPFLSSLDAWPFKCPLCPKGFPKNYEYKIHFTSRTIKCSKCSEAFLGEFCSARLFRENDELNCEKCSIGSKSV